MTPCRPPELDAFIERVIVPALVERFLAEHEAEATRERAAREPAALAAEPAAGLH